MFTYIKVGLLFLPFFWMVTRGSKQNVVLFLGSLGVLITVVQIKKLRALADCWPCILGTVIWIVASAAFNWDDLDNIYPNKPAFFGCAYGLGAGICLAHACKTKSNVWTLSAYLTVSLFLAILAIYVIRVGNFAVESHVEDGIAIRYMTDSEDLQYLRFFSIGNPVIHLTPYIAIGLGLPVLLLFPVRWFHYPPIILAAACGLYETLKLQTRMGFVSVAMASTIVGAAVFIHGGGYFRGSKKWILLSIFGVVFCLGIGVALSNPEVQSFIERLRSATRDTRLEIWAEAWSCFCARPFGGGFERMTIIAWAHNLFLDFALINGIAGFASALLIYVPALWTLLAILRNPRLMNNPMVVIVCNSFLSTFIVDMINPPFISFTIFCYIFTSFGRELLSKSITPIPDTKYTEGNRMSSNRLPPLGGWGKPAWRSESF